MIGGTSTFKLRPGEAIYIYDNRKVNKPSSEILKTMKRLANGKPFAYCIYNG